jgi:uncharacterized protein YjbJ (UPF0337 family)
MDKDRIVGSAKQIVGAIKEATGKLLGDKKTEVEGALERVNGKTQNAIGGMKDAAREILSKR